MPSISNLRFLAGSSIASALIVEYVNEKEKENGYDAIALGQIESCVYSSFAQIDPLFYRARHSVEQAIPPRKLLNPSLKKPLPAFISCGSKHDNLVHAKAALQDGIATIPSFFGFSDEQIKALLSTQTRQVWEQVCQVYQATPDKVWKLLNELESNVTLDILSAQLPLSGTQRAMLAEWKDKSLIIRSSSNEDDIAAPNAGSNKSIAGVIPTEEELKRALAEVIGSYFSQTSLRNRAAFDSNPFLEMPLCSVLIMEQITDSADTPAPIVSGVMMTHKPTWSPQKEGSISHVTASWGFGEGVVSGRVSCDEWVFAQDQIYSTIRRKPFRLQTTAKSTEMINPPELRDRPALTDAQLHQLKEVAQRLENYFERPMDIEFVFHANHLYIVQARSIQTQEINSPTFFDPSTIPQEVRRFNCKTILSDARIISLKPKHILFAENLESAVQKYDSTHHQAVIVYTKPNANSHAEVNFASKRPLVPCFVVTKEDWSTFQELEERQPCQICPQTGLILLTPADLPVRKGLFLHPAKFSISLKDENYSLQGTSSHPRIVRLEHLLRATPEELATRLDEIVGCSAHIWMEISLRPSLIGPIEKIAKKLHDLSEQVLGAMQAAASKGQPTLLAFHAGVLREILNQSAPQIVGAHSISGLEAITHLPSFIEDFIKAHQTQPILCELAMLGKKAFDVVTQQKWIRFLEKSSSLSEKRWHALLEQVKQFDFMDQLTLWFCIHFSAQEPTIQTLLVQDTNTSEFFSRCADFICRFRNLSEKVARVSTEEGLTQTWETLQKETESFLNFCTQHSESNLFKTLQISNLLFALIQLWDLNIKTFETNKILPADVVSRQLRERIAQFAAFGEQVVNQGMIRVDKQHQKELLEIFGDIMGNFPPRENRRKFSVQHWLVPRSPVYMPIYNDDQRLTIIHQNLLKVCGPSFKTVAPILPLKLAAAVETFRNENSNIAKRFCDDKGIFASLLEERALVTINIPLNYHSFVVTLQQRKNSEEIEFIAHWRGSDNWRGQHLPFFQAVAALTGIALKNFSIATNDLTVTLLAKSDKQIETLSRAIFFVNSDATSFNSLVRLMQPKKLPKTGREELKKQTSYLILDHFWKVFAESGHMDPIAKNHFEYGDGIDYLKEKNLLPEITARVVDELEGKRAKRVYSQTFLQYVLETLPSERMEEVIWNNLIGPQSISLYEIPDSCKNRLFRRLYLEQIEKYTAFKQKYSFSPLFIKEIEEAGGEVVNPQPLSISAEKASLKPQKPLPIDTPQIGPIRRSIATPPVLKPVDSNVALSTSSTPTTLSIIPFEQPASKSNSAPSRALPIETLAQESSCTSSAPASTPLSITSSIDSVSKSNSEVAATPLVTTENSASNDIPRSKSPIPTEQLIFNSNSQPTATTSLISSYWNNSLLFRIFSILSLGLLPLIIFIWEACSSSGGQQALHSTPSEGFVE